MKRCLKRIFAPIIDWKRQYLQILIILVVLFLPVAMDLTSKVLDLLNKSAVSISEVDVKYRILINLGNWAVGTVLAIIAFSQIRKSNREEILKQTISEQMVWHTLMGYRMCRFLNYRTLSLTRVPIPIQFQLIAKNIFSKYEFMENNTEAPDEIEDVKSTHINCNRLSKTVNLVLSDTYPIDFNKQIPEHKRGYSTILIDRASKPGIRRYSRAFIDQVVSEVNHLSQQSVTTINLFATINPAHCYHIASEAFLTGGGNTIEKLVVYQQSRNISLGRPFDERIYREINLR